MSRDMRSGARRFVLGAAGLGMGLLGCSLLPERAAAQGGICRSDPVLYLSNGRSVQISTAVSDARSDVFGVAYGVHLPVGTSVTRIKYTGAVPESVTLYADEPSSTYLTETTVSTGTAVSVSTTSTLVRTSDEDSKPQVLDTASASGTSGQTLSIALSG